MWKFMEEYQGIEITRNMGIPFLRVGGGWGGGNLFEEKIAHDKKKWRQTADVKVSKAHFNFTM